MSVTTTRAAVWLYFLAVVAALAAIWQPELFHYHVATPHIGETQMRALRGEPPDATLAELAGYSLRHKENMSPQQTLARATRLLQGVLELPGLAPTRVRLPFDPDDLERPSSAWQLYYASLGAADLLLDAYALEPREDFYRLARDMILSFGRYEQARWMPRGFLWNDHAVAARANVLIRFWRVYRGRADYQADIARQILVQAARCGAVLADPSQFTFSSNHGVMQNLALLQLTAAFPRLAPASAWRELAYTRLRDQLAFYVNPEGVVLEHSAGYHRHGLVLLGMAMRLAAVNGLPAPAEWREKYARALAFYALLRRPDGSLPMFGNTAGGSEPVRITSPAGAPTALMPFAPPPPPSASALYPAAGYAVWWDGLDKWPDAARLAQTVVPWSYYPGHAHKLADEMSLLLWAGGNGWITNSGYWPYDAWGRQQVDSWTGSNAPHLQDESATSARDTRLLTVGDDARVRLLDLQRRDADGFAVRRQIVHVGDDIWLVFDSAQDARARRVTRTWTAYPDLRLEPRGADGAYRYAAPPRTADLALYVSGMPEPTVRTYRGSREPFAGWVALEEKPRDAPAVMVTQSSNNAWTLALFALERDRRSPFVAAPAAPWWQGPEQWRMTLPLARGPLELSRDGATLTVSDAHGATRVALRPAPDGVAARQAVTRAFAAAAARYPKYRNLLDYRQRLSLLLLAAFLAGEAVFFIVRRQRPEWTGPLRLAGAAGWSALGWWAAAVYLHA